jgi:RHS repeat-associated protein
VRTLAGVLDTTHRYGLRYEYDIAGRFTRLFHPAQLAPGFGEETHTYTTDTGLPWRVFDPVGGFIIFTFDPKGQLVTQASPSGITRGFRYTADGEPMVDSVRNQAVGARYPLPNPTGLARYATLTYDVRGKLLRVQNTYGRREDLTSTYSPMGMVRASRFSTYGIGATGNNATFCGVDTTLSDALGNRIGGSTALSQSVSSGPGSGFLNPGGGGGNVQLTTLNFTYDASGIGRLLLSSVGAGGTSYLGYDQAGNTVQQSTAGRAATFTIPAVEPSERFMYYDALGQLRAVDSRIGPAPGQQVDLQGSSAYRLTFDTYHYDALGRRVLARSRRTCPFGSPYFVWCALGNVRRTVWSGSRELYEIQMPDSAQWQENDTATVTIGLAAQGGNPAAQFDVSPFFGRVGYVHGEGTIDQPLAVLRVNYRDNPIKPNTAVRWGFRTFWPFALYPLWDLRAEPALGSTLDGGLWPCETTAQSETRCTYAMAWTGLWAVNGVGNPGQLFAWNGSLLEDKREGNGLSFRRNRYLDPANGRFTQPDPIGLAGGLNSYGFAGGDPDNFADPFGLKVCFRGSASDVRTLREATEKATGTSITLGEDNCVVSFKSRGQKGFSELQKRFGALVDSKFTHSIQITEPLGGPQDKWTMTRAKYDGNFREVLVGRNWLGSPANRYETRRLPIWGCFWRGGAASHAALMAHELLGHAYYQDRNNFSQASGEPYARLIENEYHAAVGQPLRCIE